MIKRLHIFTLKSFIGPLILTFIIAEFVLIMQFLWLYIGDLVGKGLDWYIILEIILYFSANLVQMALPLAIFLASIMTFGNMGEHFELTAIKSAGISLQKIMIPLMILTGLISIGAFYFSNNVLPTTNLKAYSLLYDVSLQRPELNIKPGVFNDDIEGYRIKIRERKKDSPMMYDFIIYDHRENRGNTSVILADSGSMEMTNNQEYMFITLYHGNSYVEMDESKTTKRKYPGRNDNFDEEVLVIKLPESELKRTSPDAFKNDSHMKSLGELSASIDSLKQNNNNKQIQFVSSLNRHKYFKNSKQNTEITPENKSTNASLKNFTNTNQLKVVYNLDSLYVSLNDYEKKVVNKNAENNSVSIKKLISSKYQDQKLRKNNIAKHKYSWHEKLSLSFACFIFFFIGAPLGAIIRKGGFGLPFLVSIFFFLIYYLVSITGKKFAIEGLLEVWQGAWLSTALAVPLGIYFTYKASTNSALPNPNYHMYLVKKILKRN